MHQFGGSYFITLHPPFCFFEKFGISKIFFSSLNNTMLCTKGRNFVCVTLSTLYINLVKNAYGHFAILMFKKYFMLMSSCISTIGRICLMNFFYKKLFIWSYYRRKSQHGFVCLFVCFFVFFSCPWVVPLLFLVCSRCLLCFFCFFFIL